LIIAIFIFSFTITIIDYFSDYAADASMAFFFFRADRICHFVPISLCALMLYAIIYAATASPIFSHYFDIARHYLRRHFFPYFSLLCLRRFFRQIPFYRHYDDIFVKMPCFFFIDYHFFDFSFRRSFPPRCYHFIFIAPFSRFDITDFLSSLADLFSFF